MSLGYRDGIGGISFPAEETPRHVRVGGADLATEIVDDSGNYYPVDKLGRIVIPRCHCKDDSSTSGGGSSGESPSTSDSVVTSANGFTGDVQWVGGAKITVTEQNNKIKISFDSTAQDESPWDSPEDPSHDTPTDCNDPAGGGGVSGGGGGGGVPAAGGGGFPDYSGGVSAGDGQTEHGGGAGCCD